MLGSSAVNAVYLNSLIDESINATHGIIHGINNSACVIAAKNTKVEKVKNSHMVRILALLVWSAKYPAKGEIKSGGTATEMATHA